MNWLLEAQWWRTVNIESAPFEKEIISVTNRCHSFVFPDSAYYYSSNDSPNGGPLLVGGSSSDSADLINGLHTQSTISSSHEIRSPLAATRANSLASAASPTGSACILPRSSQTSEAVWTIEQLTWQFWWQINRTWTRKHTHTHIERNERSEWNAYNENIQLNVSQGLRLSILTLRYIKQTHETTKMEKILWRILTKTV